LVKDADTVGGFSKRYVAAGVSTMW
jgi:hypothetical protein